MEISSKLNTPAPDFTLPDLARRKHRLIDYRHTIVVLNFWSAECPWVARSDPQLKRYLEEWGEAVTLLLIASNANEPPEMMARVAAERGWPVILRDARGEVAKTYGAETTPHFFVIDRQGLLRYRGAFDDVTFRQRIPTVNYLKSAVEALLLGEAPNPAETPAYGCTIVYPS
jgi:peroxiredoxin